MEMRAFVGVICKRVQRSYYAHHYTQDYKSFSANLNNERFVELGGEMVDVVENVCGAKG